MPCAPIACCPDTTTDDDFYFITNGHDLTIIPRSNLSSKIGSLSLSVVARVNDLFSRTRRPRKAKVDDPDKRESASLKARIYLDNKNTSCEVAYPYASSSTAVVLE